MLRAELLVLLFNLPCRVYQTLFSTFKHDRLLFLGRWADHVITLGSENVERLNKHVLIVEDWTDIHILIRENGGLMSRFQWLNFSGESCFWDSKRSDWLFGPEFFSEVNELLGSDQN
jgi:hypothetical protein